MPTTTTELEAVNTMLRYTGESPVNVITGTGLPVHVTIAVAVLADISREVQLEGWHFNTAPKVTLSPDGSTKKIAIATDIVKIDANDKTKDVVIRGAFLYDRENATFEFDADIELNTVSLLDFTDLPESARRYITIKSSRVLQAQLVGSRELEALLARDEVMSRAELLEYDSGNSDRTIFDNFDASARVGINRNYNIS